MQARRVLPAIVGVLVAGAFPLGASARAAAGATITVNSLADTVAVDGQCTLREAIGNAEANKQKNTDCARGKGIDTIVFSGSGTIPLGGELPAVQDGLTIDGGGHIALDGGGTNRILTVNAKSATLIRLVFLHGSAPSGESGGAIQALGKALNLDSDTFVLNQANETGGAVFSAGGLTTKNSVYVENAAGGGGAIFSTGSVTSGGDVFAVNEAEGGGAMLVEGMLRMSNGVVVSNEAVVVGAIAAAANANISDTVVAANTGAFPTILVGSSLFGPITKTAPVPAAAHWLPKASSSGPDSGKATLTRDTIAGNHGSCFGGGIAAVGVDLAILESAIVGNTADNTLCGFGIGGGVLAEANNGVIANSTIAGNSAVDEAGGVAWAGTNPLAVTNATIDGNQVSGGSGTGGLALAFGQIVLTNSIVAGNYGSGDDTDCGTIPLAPLPFVSGGHNIDGDGTCGLDGTGDMPMTDPELLPLDDWGGPTPSMPPADGSPAVNAGATQACKQSPVSKHDQRGVSRPQGKACDIGAVERVGDENP